jgi:hypothetical protein
MAEYSNCSCLFMHFPSFVRLSAIRKKVLMVYSSKWKRCILVDYEKLYTARENLWLRGEAAYTQSCLMYIPT